MTRNHVKQWPMPLDHQKITRLREAAGLTKTEAARKGAMPVQKWNDIESGRYGDIRLSTVEVVTRVLGCKVDDLLTKRG